MGGQVLGTPSAVFNPIRELVKEILGQETIIQQLLKNGMTKQGGIAEDKEGNVSTQELRLRFEHKNINH